MQKKESREKLGRLKVDAGISSEPNCSRTSITVIVSDLLAAIPAETWFYFQFYNWKSENDIRCDDEDLEFNKRKVRKMKKKTEKKSKK